MQNRQRNALVKILFTATLYFAVLDTVPASGGISTSYLYNLSNFSGNVPYSWVRLRIDDNSNELYVIHQNSVSIFNEKGMKIYTFGEDLDIGRIADIAVEREGNIVVLSFRGDQFALTRCNYRGVPQSGMELRNLPDEFVDFSPDRIFSRKGKLYFADLHGKKVVVTDGSGLYQDGIDLASLLADPEDKPGAEKDIVGFSVDLQGNILFTIPTLFQAFLLSPDRKLEAFGESGSLPGKFNIAGGIASDDRGYIYVVDSLRCVVMVFDRQFRFHTEFGGRGLAPGSLIAPMEIVVDNAGRVYVTQARKRGISVFRIAYD